MRKLGILLVIGLLGVQAQVMAATVTLTGIDAIGTSSFNTAGLWDSGSAPSAGNNYFVPGGTRLRTPPDSASHTFAGDSLTINNTTPYGDGFMYKGSGSTGIITVNTLILDGGLISTANNPAADFLTLDGTVTVTANGGRLYPKQGRINVLSDISGSGTITISGGDSSSSSVVTFYSPDSSFTGNIVVGGSVNNNCGFTLAAGTAPDPNAVLNFVIGASGVNNSVSGAGASVVFNGEFNFDLTGAGTIPGDSWAIVTASNVTYGATFAVTGFTDMGDGAWQKDANGTTYQFDESTGILSVYVPELVEDPISYFLFDTEETVLNGDLALPGLVNINPGWDGESGDDIPGWTAIAPGTVDGGTGGGGTGDSADGDGWHGALNSVDPNIYNIADANMVEGIEYTFTAQFKPRWYCDQMMMSVVANDDPNFLLASNVTTFPINHLEDAAPWYAGSVSYTATASDADKKIGIYLNADDTGGWVRFDDVHLYTGYLMIHGVTDQAPDGADVVPSTPINLSWTPTNDPNFDGASGDDQVLYYYIGNGDGSNPDIASYVAASGISKGIAAASHSIAEGIDFDQYCLWRVDTVIDGITYTGKTILFTTLTADKVPAIQDWDWVRTWAGEPATIWADVNDFGEADIDLTSIAWTVTVGDPNLVLTDISANPYHPEATVVGDAPGDYEVELVITDIDGSLGAQASNTAVYQIHVYADACAAAIANGASYNLYDSDSDCDVDIVDFAAFAAQWLDDIKLTAPASY